MRLTHLFALFALVALAAACRSEPDPVVTVDEPAAQDVSSELLGTWVIVRADGSTPAEEVRLQFDPRGTLLRITGAGPLEQAQYSLVSNDTLSITDAAGTRLYGVRIAGQTATLSLEGGGETLEMTRLAGVDLSTVRPADPVPAEAAAPAETPAAATPPVTVPPAEPEPTPPATEPVPTDTLG